MLKRYDAALVIGDPALFADHDALGVEKIDLGEEWTAMTNLPFVWAFWAGRPGVVAPDDVLALQAARNAGVKETDAIAREFCDTDEDQVELGARYLRENIGYVLDDAGRAGLKKFLTATKELGVIQGDTTVTFYPSRDE